jgi:hypothetical protein
MAEHWVDSWEYLPKFITKVRENAQYRGTLRREQKLQQQEDLVPEESVISPAAKPQELTREVCTRWGSRYDAIAQFIKLKDAVKKTAKLVDDDSDKGLEFKKDLQEDPFWERLGQFKSALAPLKKLTETLGGDRYVTMSSLPTQIIGVCETLSKQHNDIAKDLEFAIRHRFLPWFQPGIALAAAVLDPEYSNITTCLGDFLSGYTSAKCTQPIERDPCKVIDATWKRLEDDMWFFCDSSRESFSSMSDDDFGAMCKLQWMWKVCRLLSSDVCLVCMCVCVCVCVCVCLQWQVCCLRCARIWRP